MAEVIPCSTDEICNCVCNCQAFLTNNRQITVDSLIIDGNNYSFNYTITNMDPSLSFIVFCIECPASIVEISGSNTSITIIGNPHSTLPITFTECIIPGCESIVENSFYVDYGLNNEFCCRYQGIKIDINPAEIITEVSIALRFTLPEDLSFGFNAGTLKIKTGQIIDIVNDLCMPGCSDNCSMYTNICNMWLLEKNILESNKNVFIHFTQLMLPEELDLDTIQVTELENKIRYIAKLEKSTANLICNIAKALERLNKLNPNVCYNGCTQLTK